MSTTNNNRLANDARNPSTARLSAKFDALRADKGLKDVKFWYGGGAAEKASVEDLAAEALSIFEANEQGQFVDIKDKLK